MREQLRGTPQLSSLSRTSHRCYGWQNITREGAPLPCSPSRASCGDAGNWVSITRGDIPLPHSLSRASPRMLLLGEHHVRGHPLAVLLTQTPEGSGVRQHRPGGAAEARPRCPAGRGMAVSVPAVTI